MQSLRMPHLSMRALWRCDYTENLLSLSAELGIPGESYLGNEAVGTQPKGGSRPNPTCRTVL